MKIATILDQIDLSTIALPHFQRGFVWNRDQVKGLINSLYRRFPIGSLLIWVTPSEGAPARGDGPLAPGVVNLLLDGQQRVTSLYGIVRGKPPKFFEGDARAFTGLHFHVEDEVFEFYMPMKMNDDPLWVNVTELFQKGAATFFATLLPKLDTDEKKTRSLARLNAIDQIKEIEIYDEKITGADKSIDVVVDIFNRINSGGTKLSKGDLALAKICASWPEAREEMRKKLAKWQKAGFQFTLEWFLRNTTAILTGEAYFESLKEVTTEQFKSGLAEAEKRVDALLNLIASRLGLDHDRVLGGRGAIPLMSRYLAQHGEKHPDHIERDKLLYWYVHTFLWGRYAGATESVLAQDLGIIKEKAGALDRLIDNLRKIRGDLTIKEQDVSGWSTGARFYPLLYLLTRVCGAKDWLSGVELSSFMLGKLSSLHVHHIFPKAVLYEKGYERSEVNAVANFTFQTQETNLWIGKKLPEKYFEEVAAKHPGALESHWIPIDKELWKPQRYRDFLGERRTLIARAANDFLESLLHGRLPESKIVEDITTRIATVAPKPVADEEEEMLLQCAIWLEQQGLPAAEIQYELCDESGNVLAVLDLAWPEGMQPGLSKPVALILDDDKEPDKVLNQRGFLYFKSVEDLKKYVEGEILK
ncbi:MAG: GmrSD restriction endonuclease domain-containing protein [Desulfomonilaceae bacterium]